MPKVVSIFRKPGVLRETAIRHIKRLTGAIRFQKIAQKDFKFINVESSLTKPVMKNIPKRNPLIKSFFITGRSKKSLKQIRSDFVLPGESYLNKSNIQRLKDAMRFVGSKAIKRRKALENARRKLGKSVVAKDVAFNRLVKKETIKSLLAELKLFGPGSQKAISKVHAMRRLDARTRGITFRRIKGRIVPIKKKR